MTPVFKQPSNAIGYAKFYSRSHDAVIRVYDEAGNMIETHKHVGEFKKRKGACARLIFFLFGNREAVGIR